MYYKNQYYLITFSILGFLYFLFLYLQDSKLEKDNKAKSYVVVVQKCRNSKGGSSEIIFHISLNQFPNYANSPGFHQFIFKIPH